MGEQNIGQRWNDPRLRVVWMAVIIYRLTYGAKIKL
jgi:hypothetical protein